MLPHVVVECVEQLDRFIHIKHDSGYNAEPLHDQDRQATFQQLLAAKACHYVPGRVYTHFQGAFIQENKRRHSMGTFHRLDSKESEEIHKDYVKSKR